MSYYKLRNTCDIYNEPSTALTSNNKYINPFVGNTEKVSYYNDNIYRLNSYKYNNNNLYTYTKSYVTIDDSYKHYVDTILDLKRNLLKQEKQLIDETTDELNKLRKITNKDSS